MLKRRKRVLKRSESGIETEFNIINSKGEIFSDSRKLIKKTLQKYDDVDLDTEATLNCIEIRSKPYVKLRDVLLSMMNSISKVNEIAHEMDLMLLPMGTYMGKFNEVRTPKKRYKLIAAVLGKEKRYYATARNCAFHFHYALPKGVFHKRKKSLKKLKKSITKDTLINSHNLMVAADPALSTMLQSSPFVDGKYLGKDSRLILYRGGKELGYPKSLYADYKQLGALQYYVETLSDLQYRITEADEFFRAKLIEKGFSKEAKKKELLDFLWTPIKINKIGTLEQRSCDINQPKYIIAASVLMKSVLRALQQEFYEVKASDIGLEEPFKIEGDKIHIPPILHLKKKLQYEALWNGFDSKEVYTYTKRFFKFGKKMTSKEYRHLLSPLGHLIDRKKTVSDVLIRKVKQKGYSLDEKIPPSVCRELSIKSAEHMLKEFDKTLKTVEKIH